LNEIIAAGMEIGLATDEYAHYFTFYQGKLADDPSSNDGHLSIFGFICGRFGGHVSSLQKRLSPYATSFLIKRGIH